MTTNGIQNLVFKDSTSPTRLRQRRIKEEFSRKIAEISTYDFVQKHVCRYLPEYQDTQLQPDEFAASVVQNDGTGPATVKYSIKGSAGAFAKLYADESGRHCYNVLCRLRDTGFNAQDGYLVAEPLCFLTELNILLMREAQGESVASQIAQDNPLAANGVREAAKWLLRLHNSSTRIGKVDAPWYILSKLSARLSKAARSHPEELDRITTMLKRLQKVSDRLGRVELTQTHGQYRPVHVFLGDETVTVVDLDRSRPSDPAKDLAEFIHRMRSNIFHHSASLNDMDYLTGEFLKEYATERPSGLENLQFYQCYHILVSICRNMTKTSTQDPSWEPMVTFYTNEFESAMSGKFSQLR